jgi:hypothetical protein
MLPKSIFIIMYLSLALVSPIAQAQTTELAKQLEALTNAKGIEGSRIGYAATPNPAYEPIERTFRQALKQGNSIEISQIKELMKQASPAVRLYLAALIQRLDKKEGDRLLSDLQSDESIVTERSGCTLDSRTVGDVAAELLKNGSVAIALP